jgi:prevent-host-death family protein
MKMAAVSQLKARLSEYLNQVKAGGEILITDRGEPVARLVPILRSQVPNQSMAKMEREGLIKLGSGKLPKDFWTMPRPDDPKSLLLKALLEERETGR